jgi:uroporphyrinogen-III synthase
MRDRRGATEVTRPTGAHTTDAVIGFARDQLVGFRIGVTSDRRSGDLIAALERRGA